MIPFLRQPNPAMPAPTNEDLQRGGAFTVEEQPVRGPEGAPGRVAAHLQADVRHHPGARGAPLSRLINLTGRPPRA